MYNLKKKKQTVCEFHRNQICDQCVGIQLKEEKRDAAYCFIEPGDRTASEAEGIITVLRTRS